MHIGNLGVLAEWREVLDRRRRHLKFEEQYYQASSKSKKKRRQSIREHFFYHNQPKLVSSNVFFRDILFSDKDPDTKVSNLVFF